MSVVVPTRDRPALLAGALASIRALEGPDLTFEILVGDNGGLAETAQVAAEAGARLVPAPGNGAAAGRNAAMREATGEFIAFLDDDDAWLPGHIRAHLALLDSEPGFAGVVGQVTNADEELASFGPAWPEALPTDGDLFRSFLEYYPQLGATVVRRKAIELAGYFDEGLTFDQDWDWHLRLALACRVGFVAVPCAQFRQRPPGQHDALQWRRLGYTHRVFWRNLRRAGIRRLPAPHALARLYLRKFAHYEAYFAASARAHAAAGRRRSAWRAMGQGFVASPLHLARDLVTSAETRAALLPG